MKRYREVMVWKRKLPFCIQLWLYGPEGLRRMGMARMGLVEA